MKRFNLHHISYRTSTLPAKKVSASERYKNYLTKIKLDDKVINGIHKKFADSFKKKILLLHENVKEYDRAMFTQLTAHLHENLTMVENQGRLKRRFVLYLIHLCHLIEEDGKSSAELGKKLDGELIEVLQEELKKMFGKGHVIADAVDLLIPFLKEIQEALATQHTLLKKPAKDAISSILQGKEFKLALGKERKAIVNLGNALKRVDILLSAYVRERFVPVKSYSLRKIDPEKIKGKLRVTTDFSHYLHYNTRNSFLQGFLGVKGKNTLFMEMWVVGVPPKAADDLHDFSLVLENLPSNFKGDFYLYAKQRLQDFLKGARNKFSSIEKKITIPFSLLLFDFVHKDLYAVSFGTEVYRTEKSGKRKRLIKNSPLITKKKDILELEEQVLHPKKYLFKLPFSQLTHVINFVDWFGYSSNSVKFPFLTKMDIPDAGTLAQYFRVATRRFKKQEDEIAFFMTFRSEKLAKTQRVQGRSVTPKVTQRNLPSVSNKEVSPKNEPMLASVKKKLTLLSSPEITNRRDTVFIGKLMEYIQNEIRMCDDKDQLKILNEQNDAMYDLLNGVTSNQPLYNKLIAVIKKLLLKEEKYVLNG